MTSVHAIWTKPRFESLLTLDTFVNDDVSIFYLVSCLYTISFYNVCFELQTMNTLFMFIRKKILDHLRSSHVKKSFATANIVFTVSINIPYFFILFRLTDSLLVHAQNFLLHSPDYMRKSRGALVRSSWSTPGWRMQHCWNTWKQPDYPTTTSSSLCLHVVQHQGVPLGACCYWYGGGTNIGMGFVTCSHIRRQIAERDGQHANNTYGVTWEDWCIINEPKPACHALESMSSEQRTAIDKWGWPWDFCYWILWI